MKLIDLFLKNHDHRQCATWLRCLKQFFDVALPGHPLLRRVPMTEKGICGQFSKGLSPVCVAPSAHCAWLLETCQDLCFSDARMTQPDQARQRSARHTRIAFPNHCLVARACLAPAGTIDNTVISAKQADLMQNQTMPSCTMW